ncbi:Lrp/AsnC family transcriptional regulator [Flagellimonas sp. S3867]|uniref:Lrp/AsnC family transcriptional regulator n=1 Tax=Flagellimonas sp. S3867 TaxID=2768063 RepID=UPI0016889AA1|nr:Lrp/AsnC family transcriptional regulator [Flagellimonas sp. S3867]
MDSINKRILKALTENGRSSFVEIGRKVGLSAPSVAERIQKMEELGLITGYSVKLNLAKLDYHIQANIALKIDSNRFKAFASKLEDFPEIFECIKVTGEYCVYLKAALRNNDALENLIDRLTTYGQPNTSIILSDYSKKSVFIP